MNMKKITSMTMLWSLIILILNSVVLYVVPEGRVSHWAVWQFLGLTKEDWSAQHTTVGFLFLFAGLLHIYYNWKPILAYMKNKAQRVNVFTGASSVGLALTIIFVVGTYFNVPPMSTIMDISEHFKSTATVKYGEPPYGQAQSSSLQMFTERVNLDLQKSIELLEAAGISVSGEKETLSDIGKRSGKTPQQIYEIIQSATRQMSEPLAEHSDNPDTSMIVPLSGMGKKTVTQMCSEIGVDDCDQVIKKLEEKGIKVEAGEKIKDAAAAHGLDPMQIYEAMTEIVSKESSQ
jgi:hypothetical protein